MSPAELRQRRDAARRRWGLAAASTALGAVAGAEIARHGQAINNQNRAAAAAEMAGILRAEQLKNADEAVLRRAAERRAAYTAAIKYRLRANAETNAERKARMARIIANPFDPAARAPSGPPVIGTDKNNLIYDYQIDRTARELKAEARHLARLDADFDADPRKLREQKRRVNKLTEDLAELKRRKAAAHTLIARAGSTRKGKGGKDVNVQPHAARQARGGDTLKQKQQRIRQEKGRLNLKQIQLDRLHERRTAVVRQAEHDRILAESTAAVREAFERGRFGASLRAAGLRGGLLGGGIGLTAAGLGLLAHHVATSHERARPMQKSWPLQKAEADGDPPERQIHRGLAETYRDWIDRLLGRSPAQGAINFGDDIARAIGPGITQAFAEGARNAALTPPDGPPYWLDVEFDKLNPSVRRHMASYALDRIVQITDAQREAIRQAIMQQSVLQGIGPYEVARTIKEGIGLTAYQMSVVQSFRQQLHDLDPRVFERKLRDGRYDRTIQKAMDSGVPLTGAQIDAMVDAYHRRFVAYRAGVIARTEGLRATSFGALAQAQAMLDAHPELDVIKRWLATHDERTRDTHVDLDGREVEGLQTPFLTSAGNQIRWPLDVNSAADETIQCRCTLQFIYKPKRGLLRAA